MYENINVLIVDDEPMFSSNEKLWQNQGFEYHFFDKSNLNANDLKPLLKKILKQY